MMLPSRLDCPLSLKTPNMGNPGLYNIGVSALSTHNNLSPSTERCERRASRATLALVDELTGLLIVPSGVTGWRSLALVDELTGADLDVLALVYMLGQLQRIQPEALDAPDFVGIGAKPARQDGRRGPRSSRSGPPCYLPAP